MDMDMDTDTDMDMDMDMSMSMSVSGSFYSSPSVVTIQEKASARFLLNCHNAGT